VLQGDIHEALTNQATAVPQAKAASELNGAKPGNANVSVLLAVVFLVEQGLKDPDNQ
jgi:hypothetical protein